MISLGLATYNGEKYIEKQLISLLNQTMKIDEVIICDDCSSDNTVRIIKQFIAENKLLNWKLLINDVNLGYQKNFYKILNETIGDIIFLCDQDDIWELNKVETCYKVLKNNSQIQLLSCSFRIIDQNDNFVEINKNPNYSNNNLLKFKVKEHELIHVPFEYLYMHENYAQGCCMCFTKSIKKIYMDLNVENIIHDFALNLIASINESSYFINFNGIRYRIHGANAVGYKTKNSLSIKEKLDLNYRVNIFAQPLYFTEQEYSFFKNNSDYFKNIPENMYEYLETKINFYKQRKRILENKKTIAYILLLFKTSYLENYISKKVIIIDILSIIYNKLKTW